LQSSDDKKILKQSKMLLNFEPKKAKMHDEKFEFDFERIKTKKSSKI